MKNIGLILLIGLGCSSVSNALSVKEVGKYVDQIPKEFTHHPEMRDGTLVQVDQIKFPQVPKTIIRLLKPDHSLKKEVSLGSGAVFFSHDRREIIFRGPRSLVFLNSKGEEVRSRIPLKYYFQGRGEILSFSDGGFVILGHYADFHMNFYSDSGELLKEVAWRYKSPEYRMMPNQREIGIFYNYRQKAKMKFFNSKGEETRELNFSMWLDHYSDLNFFSNGDFLFEGENYARAFTPASKLVQEFRWAFGERVYAKRLTILRDDVLVVSTFRDFIHFYERSGKRTDFSVVENCPSKDKKCGKWGLELLELPNRVLAAATECGYVFLFDHQHEFSDVVQMDPAGCDLKKNHSKEVLLESFGMHHLIVTMQDRIERKDSKKLIKIFEILP